MPTDIKDMDAFSIFCENIKYYAATHPNFTRLKRGSRIQTASGAYYRLPNAVIASADEQFMLATVNRYKIQSQKLLNFTLFSKYGHDQYTINPMHEQRKTFHSLMRTDAYQGVGGQGYIKQAYVLNDTGETPASVYVKIIKLARLTPDKHEKATIAMSLEADIHRHLHGKGELINDVDTLYLVMKDLGKKNLFELVNQQSIDLNTALSILELTAGQIQVLHDADVIHRDIKLENILFDPITKQVSLIDFGLSKQRPNDAPVHSPDEPIVGTLPFVAPELFIKQTATKLKPTDTWSFALTAIELLTTIMNSLEMSSPHRPPPRDVLKHFFNRRNHKNINDQLKDYHKITDLRQRNEKGKDLMKNFGVNPNASAGDHFSLQFMQHLVGKVITRLKVLFDNADSELINLSPNFNHTILIDLLTRATSIYPENRPTPGEMVTTLGALVVNDSIGNSKSAEEENIDDELQFTLRLT
jgi:serine/threonine protein kinase